MDFNPEEFVEEYREEALPRLQTIAECLLRLEADPDDTTVFDEMLRAAHTLKGSSRMMGFVATGDAAHHLEDRILEIKRREVEATPERIDELLGLTDALSGMVMAPVGSDEELGEQPAEPPPEAVPIEESLRREPVAETAASETNSALAQSSVRVRVEKLDRLAELVDETILGESRTQVSATKLEELEDLARSVVRSDVQAGISDDLRRRSESLYAGLRRLRVAAEGEELSFSLVTDELRRSAAQIRTLPLATVFTPLPRLVRDTARERGKEAELVTEGGEVELDRTVLSALPEPLGHLIRNAVDHGIEPPDDRESLGKPRTGTVTLTAEQSGGWVDVTIQDDGGGLDLDALRRKASEQGLDPDLGEDLIFAPGLSTAGSITHTSGRGVGMDVVRAQVAALGGTVRVNSEPGRGTTFTLRLPFTLGVTRAILLRCGPEQYALPTAAVEEVVPAGKLDRVSGREYLDYRGNAIPVLRLATILGVSENGSRMTIILRWGAGQVALLLDEVVEEMEISLKGFGPLLSGVPGLSGYTVLGNGDVVVVLDPGYLAGGSPVRAAASTVLYTSEPAAKRMLVVDDSPPTRGMLKSFLEREGFEVIAAKDGREALAALDVQEFSAVVTDVDMPVMDGIQLTEGIRSRPNLRRLPVIVLSSRGDERDIRRGREAGADAYIIKQDFTAAKLLGTIERFVG